MVVKGNKRLNNKKKKKNRGRRNGGSSNVNDENNRNNSNNVNNNARRTRTTTANQRKPPPPPPAATLAHLLDAEARACEDKRKAADLFKKAFRSDNDEDKLSPLRVRSFFSFLGCVDTKDYTKEDKKFLRKIVDADNQPAFFRSQAAHQLSSFATRVNLDLGLSAEYCRLSIAICNSASAEEKCRILVSPNGGGFELRIGDNLLESQQSSQEHLDGIKSVAGGEACDWCSKTLEQLGVINLKVCSRCKLACFCSEGCLSEAWIGGHNKACRKPGQIETGDFMIASSSNDGKLEEVIVLGPEENDSENWIVIDCSNGTRLSVPGDQLVRFHKQMGNVAEIAASETIQSSSSTNSTGEVVIVYSSSSSSSSSNASDEGVHTTVESDSNSTGSTNVTVSQTEAANQAAVPKAPPGTAEAATQSEVAVARLNSSSSAA